MGVGRGQETQSPRLSSMSRAAPGIPSRGGQPVFQNLQGRGCPSPTKLVQSALALSFPSTKDARGGVFGETPSCLLGRAAQPPVGTGRQDEGVTAVTAVPVQEPRVTSTKAHHGSVDKVTSLPVLRRMRVRGLFKWFLNFVFSHLTLVWNQKVAGLQGGEGGAEGVPDRS